MVKSRSVVLLCLKDKIFIDLYFFFVDIFDAPKLSQLCASWRSQRIWKVSSPSFKSSKSLHVCQNCCIWYWLCVTFNSSLTCMIMLVSNSTNYLFAYVTWTCELKKINSKWVSLKTKTRLIVIWKIIVKSPSPAFLEDFRVGRWQWFGLWTIWRYLLFSVIIIHWYQYCCFY